MITAQFAGYPLIWASVQGVCLVCDVWSVRKPRASLTHPVRPTLHSGGGINLGHTLTSRVALSWATPTSGTNDTKGCHTFRIPSFPQADAAAIDQQEELELKHLC